ncbi:MAG TPA: L,D-transpeptidase family protein [Gaiellaceae bacterium]
MKRLFFPALFAVGFVAAGTFSGVVIAGGTSTGTTTTTVATTPLPPTTTEPAITTVPTTTASVPASAKLPARVRVAGVRVGGLTPAAAVSAVEAAFARPLVVVVDRAKLTLDPTSLATPYANTAVARARISAPGSNAHLVVNVRGSQVRAWAARIAHRFERPSSDASLAFVNGKPRLTRERVGRALDAHKLTVRIVSALRANSRLPLHVKTRAVSPAVTATSFGPDIVINRALNRLTLYDGARFVRSFPVATGQAIYPTPKGVFHIVVKWENPWWYPPTQDAWARGLQPVPPGPSNPLGTRWMGLSAPGIGIHGTDEPASIGYSASHGCIRMQVPDAEWLFTRVDIGTTVDII